MSKINIKRALEVVRSGQTTVYTPVVELIVNAIQAIGELDLGSKGRVSVRVVREKQQTMDGLPEVEGFEVEDNGIGFTDDNLQSFDTMFTARKIQEGGKGFGRFFCLKYFRDVWVSSTYTDGDGTLRSRGFKMGAGTEIVEGKREGEATKKQPGTVVALRGPLKPFGDKELRTIAVGIAEKLLPYFIDDEFPCPSVVVAEKDGTHELLLNGFVASGADAKIVEIDVDEPGFSLETAAGDEFFAVRVFKLYSQRNRKSKLALVGNKREVGGSTIHNYVPEFEDEFYDEPDPDAGRPSHNYIVKAYVMSDYLDRNVSLERGGFEFKPDRDVVLGIGQEQIEREAADFAKRAMGDDITTRAVKKRSRVESYVKDRPWYKAKLQSANVARLPMNPSDLDIERCLHDATFAAEREIRRDFDEIMKNPSFADEHARASEIAGRISEASRDELVHYVALRRSLLELFGKSLESEPDGSYAHEGTVHDIVFPRRSDSESTPFEDHNLWLLDERLNFTEYVRSDMPVGGPGTKRPDVLAFDHRVVFRGAEEASNPVTIFEFKRPFRDDFVDPSAKKSEDPIAQVIRYRNEIQEGKHKTWKGRRIHVDATTPFYGYVVCDLTPKVERWLKEEKDMTPMPDRLGWFQWRSNINLYIEVLAWEKVLKDARIRNQVFFKKLGIDADLGAE